jgi:hypothetical protein
MYQAKQTTISARTTTGVYYAKAASFSRQENLESSCNVVAGLIDSLLASARCRHERRVTTVMVPANLGLDDALSICTIYLDQHCAGDPHYDSFGNIRKSADWWADLANIVEFQCYFAAAMKYFKDQISRVKARKCIFTALWFALTNEDRQASLTRVDAKGNFYRKGGS